MKAGRPALTARRPVPGRGGRRRPATMARLQSRWTVLWDAMEFSSVRHGWMAALIASFLALFVLVSAVEAAVCAPEAATAHASETVSDTPADPDDNDRPEQHAICSHGHCHHSGVATAATPGAPVVTHAGADLDALPLADGLPSRMPAGPDRPPRG